MSATIAGWLAFGLVSAGLLAWLIVRPNLAPLAERRAMPKESIAEAQAALDAQPPNAARANTQLSKWEGDRA